MSRTGGRIPVKVIEAVKAFSLAKKIPFGQYPILLNLALKSYKALPFEKRETWSLEEIIKQGL